MTNQRGEGEGEGAGSGSGSGRGQSEDPEPDEDQSQPEGTPDSRTAEASSWPTGDLETDNQINVKIFLRKQARLELHRKVGFTGTTIRDENLRKQVDRLMHTQLNDTSSPNINYGHRRWPVEMRGGVDDFIRDLMLDIWLNEFDWRTDPLHAERCRTLVNEFQRTGLPQTIHYDLNDELELRHGSEEARNQAYRCPCWEEALGEGWFNHSDATLIETIGPGWGMENQHLLLHLLTRLLIAMTCSYIQNAPECLVTNTLFRNKYAKRRRHNWWPRQCVHLFEKMRELKGIAPDSVTGQNMKLNSEGYQLVQHLTGIPYDEVYQRLKRQDALDRYRKRRAKEKADAEGVTEVVQAVQQDATTVRGSTGTRPPTRTPRKKKQVHVSTAGTAVTADTILMPPPPPPPGSSVRTFGGYITVDERRFWESYLLEERMLDPRFQVGLITAEKRKEFLETVALPEHVQDEQVFQKKVKYLISTYLYAKDQKHYRGRRHEIEAIAAYNKIALHQGAPLYDKENIANNNKQWCRLAARFVTQVEGDLDERLRTGEMPPSNYDAREQASSNEAQENFNETVQMNVAIERSLQDQRAPTGLPAVAQRPGATSGSESWADRQELAKALQESRAMFAARHGRPPEAPVVIRNPEEIERERKQREQAEAREKRKEPTKSPPVKKRKKKLPPAPGGSSRPSDVARSPSPLRQPDVPMGTDDQQADQVLEDLDLFTAEDFEVSALQEPLLEGSVGAQLNLEPAAGDTQLGSQTQDVPEDLDLFTEEGFFRSIEQEPLNESVQRRLYVGPQSAVSLAEGLLDQVIAADDEIRNSPDVQNYLDLVNVSPTVQGQALLEVPALGEVGEEDWVDVTRKSIQATAEEFRHSQNPGRGFEGQGGGEGSPGEAISDWSPGQLLRWSPGSWSSGGSPGGGEPGGGGGPSSPDGGVDDDDDVNILNFVDMYERIALDHPDVLVYIRWPPKLERFNYWVMYKWPDFYTCVRWPRFIPDELPDVNLLDEYLIGVY